MSSLRKSRRVRSSRSLLKWQQGRMGTPLSGCNMKEKPELSTRTQSSSRRLMQRRSLVQKPFSRVQCWRQRRCEKNRRWGSRQSSTTSAQEALLAVKIIISAIAASSLRNSLQCGRTLMPAWMVEPPSTGKSSLTVQLLDISSQWIRVSSRSKQMVLSLGLFFASLISLETAGLRVLPMRTAQTVCRKCWRESATKYPFSLTSADLAMREMQYELLGTITVEAFLLQGLSGYLLFSMGNLRSCLMFFPCIFSPQLSNLLFPSNFSSVKLLFALIFSYTRAGVSLARQAPILLSKEEPTLRSQVLSLKEYLYFGTLTASI